MLSPAAGIYGCLPYRRSEAYRSPRRGITVHRQSRRRFDKKRRKTGRPAPAARPHFPPAADWEKHRLFRTAFLHTASVAAEQKAGSATAAFGGRRRQTDSVAQAVSGLFLTLILGNEKAYAAKAHEDKRKRLYFCQKKDILYPSAKGRAEQVPVLSLL